MSDLLNKHKLKHNLDNYRLAYLDEEAWLIPKVETNCMQNPTMKFKLYTIDECANDFFISFFIPTLRPKSFKAIALS